jgi:hypothetical protein
VYARTRVEQRKRLQRWVESPSGLARIVLIVGSMLFDHEHTRVSSTPSRADVAVDRRTPTQSAYDLLYDIWSYRSRRQEMIRGGATTSTDLAGFLALERMLRGKRSGEDDMRAFQRFNCSIPAVLSFGDGHLAAVQVTNVSADGAAINHRVRLHAGQVIGLRFTLAQPSSMVTFDFQGRIIWAWKQAAGIMYAGGAETTIVHDAPERPSSARSVFQTAPAANDMPTRFDVHEEEVRG